MLTGKQILAARKAKGWSQARLADKVGVSTEAVSKWERDSYSPKGINAETLCEVLGLDYLDEEGTPRNARLFNEVRMSSFLKGKMTTGNY